MKTITNDTEFNKEISATDKLVLVDFFATWCGPCQILGPILEKLSKDFEGKIVFAKADVDNVPLASQKFGVEKIPTVILFKNQKVVSGFVGLIPENKIKEWLENILEKDKK
jgi:thioredoxin 1